MIRKLFTILFFFVFLGLCLVNKTYLGSLYYYIIDHQETFLSSGEVLDLELSSLHDIDYNYGEWLVHPCVRYIPKGINGHKWWMVVTPYPNHNNKYEQPALFLELEMMFILLKNGNL